MILLPQPLDSWDFRCEPPHPALKFFGFWFLVLVLGSELRASHLLGRHFLVFNHLNISTSPSPKVLINKNWSGFKKNFTKMSISF
jgi:hypothetical protein